MEKSTGALSLGQHQEAFADDIVRLLLEAKARGYKVRFGEALRTPEQQQLYMQSGRTKTMNSMHLKKCAFDLHFIDPKGNLCYPQELGDYWEKLNTLNQWGGNWKTFKDQPHFQRTV